MTTTPKGFPYPESDATPDVPRDIKALALALDAAPQLAAAGTLTVTGTALTPGYSTTATVVLPVGLFTVAPLINATMSSSPAGSANLVVRTDMQAAASFRVVVFNAGDAAATFAATGVSWFAVKL